MKLPPATKVAGGFYVGSVALRLPVLRPAEHHLTIRGGKVLPWEQNASVIKISAKTIPPGEKSSVGVRQVDTGAGAYTGECRAR